MALSRICVAVETSSVLVCRTTLLSMPKSAALHARTHTCVHSRHSRHTYTHTLTLTRDTRTLALLQDTSPPAFAQAGSSLRAGTVVRVRYHWGENTMDVPEEALVLGVYAGNVVSTPSQCVYVCARACVVHVLCSLIHLSVLLHSVCVKPCITHDLIPRFNACWPSPS